MEIRRRHHRPGGKVHRDIAKGVTIRPEQVCASLQFAAASAVLRDQTDPWYRFTSDIGAAEIVGSDVARMQGTAETRET